MLQALKAFRVGRPQIFAGLMLLAFLAQCLWVSGKRPFSPLEYEYINSGLPQHPGLEYRVTSPLTGWLGAMPFRLARQAGGTALTERLMIPRPWLVRLPFVMFGVWLGGALWWVARRLFDDAGGYIALALYCSSPAMVMISSNIGPEIILAWSGFGLIYTAIGVAHTLYAPPRKWAPRILILGLAIGFSLATALWSFVLIPLALAFMLYLAPGRRREVMVVLLSALAIGLGVHAFIGGLVGAPLMPPRNLITPHMGWDLLHNFNFVFADSYLRVNSVLFVALFIASLTAYGSWQRARYFGNTAPLVTAFAVVLLFALVPDIHVWHATLGLSFVFVFIGGVQADLLETSFHRWVANMLAASILLRAVLGLWALSRWTGIRV